MVSSLLTSFQVWNTLQPEVLGCMRACACGGCVPGVRASPGVHQLHAPSPTLTPRCRYSPKPSLGRQCWLEFSSDTLGRSRAPPPLPLRGPEG